MALVGNVIRKPLLVPDMLHNLVFAFTRNIMPCTPISVAALGLTVSRVYYT